MLKSLAVACLLSAAVVEAQFRFGPQGDGQRGPSRRGMPASRGGNIPRPQSRGRMSGAPQRRASPSRGRGPSRSAPSRGPSRSSSGPTRMSSRGPPRRSSRPDPDASNDLEFDSGDNFDFFRGAKPV